MKIQNILNLNNFKIFYKKNTVFYNNIYNTNI